MWWCSSTRTAPSAVAARRQRCGARLEAAGAGRRQLSGCRCAQPQCVRALRAFARVCYAQAELRRRVHGQIVSAVWERKQSHCQPRDREPEMRWRLRFASHAAAESAVAAGVEGAIAIFTFYNDRR